jgi:hypothetical protein
MPETLHRKIPNLWKKNVNPVHPPLNGRSMVSKKHKTMTAKENTAKKPETQGKHLNFHCVHKSGTVLGINDENFSDLLQ